MKDRLTKLFTTFLAVVLLVGMSPAAASTAYAASWNSGTVASLNLGNKLSGFFDRLFGSSNKNDSNPGQTGKTEEKDSTEQGGNQLTANGGTSNDTVTEDDITLTKTAEDKGKDGQGNQLFDIKLGVQGKEKITNKKIDIVLILDASSSMTEELQNMTKNAANTFVDKVFEDKGVDAKVAVVSYGKEAAAKNYTNNSWTYYGNSFNSKNNYSDSTTAIKNAIAGVYRATNGSTNTEGAFLVAQELTNVKRSDAEHLTVFMTDGVPTCHYITNRWGIDTSGGNSWTKIDDYNEALTAAINLGKVSNVYNVALTGALSDYPYDTTIAQKFMGQPPYMMTRDSNYDNHSPQFSTKASESYAKAYYNITTTNENDASSQMEEIYRNIASQAISLVKNGVVTDILPADFKLTEQGKKTLRDAGVTIIENADKTTTITYTNVAAEKVVTNLPTISVKYTGNGYGAAYTNSSATYSGKLYNGTESGKDFTKDFPKPVAGLHPKTVDDADSTSVGTTITVDVRKNDPFKQLTVTGYEVSDYTIVLTDKDGNPKTYDGDFIASIVDGKLQFKSSTAGTKELYYVVKANITQKGDNFATKGQKQLESRPTKVTIDVYGAANKAYVIDFGKPVTYTDTFTEAEKQATITLNGATNNVKAGTYGQMTLNGNGESITYKLTKFMDNIDVFTFNELYNNKVNVEKTVSMLPASSIYYEDNFDDGTKDEKGNLNTVIKYGNGWQVLGKDTIPGIDGDGNLGYDSAYDTSNSQLVYSGGTIHYVPKSNNIVKADFTFTGQGIDIYSYASGNTGRFMFRLYDKDNNLLTSKSINTKYNSGGAYQLPVATFMGNESQTYRVEIIVPRNNAFYLDAVRIYNSVKVDVDNESSAKFVSIREQSLLSDKADLFTVDGNVFIDAYLKNNAKVVAIPDKMDEYTAYGRKTEVVIAPGDSITLTLQNAAKAYSKVQLGARIDAAVPTQRTEITIPENLTNEVLVNNKDIGVKSSTDMYYTVDVVNGKLVITNNTNKLLALTKLKLLK
ncbi:vWA domain-containing protein [Intestinibacter bartlettii]|uniref:vWA domain-containing protein n=1 Tax=Intestinibacter bartlettii TaxID=261299 RepID=UPI00248A94D9|nr:vWA domain-containing protein [Intestinibacter bartlettii]